MNIIGNRTTFIINILTFCLASGSLAERSWINHKVYGDYAAKQMLALLLPVAVSFILRNRVVSIILLCLHGLLFPEMTYLATHVGDERVSYVSGSTFIFTAVLLLSAFVVGLYLLGAAVVRIFDPPSGKTADH
jgi:hypothetical protein